MVLNVYCKCTLKICDFVCLLYLSSIITEHLICNSLYPYVQPRCNIFFISFSFPYIYIFTLKQLYYWWMLSFPFKFYMVLTITLQIFFFLLSVNQNSDMQLDSCFARRVLPPPPIFSKMKGWIFFSLLFLNLAWLYPNSFLIRRSKSNLT